MNTCNLVGRLGGDIELSHTKSGTAVADVNLAVDDGHGEKKRTYWIGLKFWGQTAELAAKHLGKGRMIAITGRLTQDEWQDKQSGQKRTKTLVTVERLHFLPDGGKRESAPAGGNPERRSTGSYAETGDLGEGGPLPF